VRECVPGDGEAQARKTVVKNDLLSRLKVRERHEGGLTSERESHDGESKGNHVCLDAERRNPMPRRVSCGHPGGCVCHLCGNRGMTTTYLLLQEGKSVVVLDDGPVGGPKPNARSHTCRTRSMIAMETERWHGE